MVAIRNEHGFVTHSCRCCRDHAQIRQRPQTMDHAEMVCGFEWWLTGNRVLQQILDRVLGVRIDPKDLAQISSTGGREQQSILLRGGVSLLVRIDPPLAESLEAHASHKAATSVVPSSVI